MQEWYKKPRVLGVIVPKSLINPYEKKIDSVEPFLSQNSPENRSTLETHYSQMFTNLSSDRYLCYDP
ncbi:hypothetical protein NG796_11550 [Laspinema sp. A4]|uniref:hypothetical protein n=1 Tax=Laspinema sp. D2d TaxID=2953686 RepID=UPI0021BB78B4|nr:hypothetical protein [Laspinema sp. D2d]MCT7983932.1 hypothetical protein [Laspinema sp. D2d]